MTKLTRHLAVGTKYAAFANFVLRDEEGRCRGYIAAPSRSGSPGWLWKIWGFQPSIASTIAQAHEQAERCA